MAPTVSAMMASRQLALTKTAAVATRTTTSTIRASASSMVVASRQQQQRGYATPKGPPPANFRTSRPVEWHWEKDTTLDRLGKYFLMTEMARGMYVLLEQYFRPPYTIYYPFEKVRCHLEADDNTDGYAWF
jgi:NADH dehydrogenase (ubiquinone) Fe-S protein 8